MLNEKSIEIYSSRDKIRGQLIDLAKDYLQLENFDYNKSSYLSYIINMLSFLDSNLLYYISSVYREQFLSKAIQRESVLNLSNIIGYKPPFATPAIVKVLIEIPYDSNITYDREIQLIGRSFQSQSTEDSNLPIFKVYSNDNIPFSLIDTVIIQISRNNIVKVLQQVFLNNYSTISTGWKTIEHRFVNGNIQIVLDFIQLVDITETFTIPELLPNEFHNITYNFTKNGSISDIQLFTISTDTNGVLEKWTRKESIFGIGPNESAYTYRETDKGVIISFGNGVIGKQPKKGTNVILNIGITQGFDGNVIAGSIKKSDTARTANDTTSGVTYTTSLIKVINQEPSQFGENSPTIDEIRRDAMNSVSSNNRLVSFRDYENADLIVPNLPIRNVFQVLKRSDLKRNEIALFSEMIYNNVVVPTRNATIEIPDTLLSGQTEYHIKAVSTENVVNIDSEDYISLFDVFFYPNTNEVKYYYYINEAQNPVTITSTIDTVDPTKILPIFASFTSDRTSVNEELIVNLHCNVLDATSTYKCELLVDWPTAISQVYTLYDNTSSVEENITSVKVFSTRLDPDNTTDTATPIYLNDIPMSYTVEFTFVISKVVGSVSTELNRSKTSIILKKDLSDFMYSQLEYRDATYFVHDVPLVKQDYYDNLINPNIFTSTVLQKIINFNVYEYRMITDFVNLKFANTTGYSTNMKFRSITKSSVIDINPTSIPDLSDVPLQDALDYRYALTDNNNPWAVSNDYPDITGGGIIVYYTGTTWKTEKLKVNDIFDVTNLNGINNSIEDEDDRITYRMIYNGKEILEPKFKIPLEVKMVVIPSDDLRMTDQVLVKTIKDTLVTKLSPFFGYNKSILRSVIIKIVQDVPGVEHVELIEPAFNIKFENDPYKNMTQDQLLRYTPELIFFSTENITIELKDE